MGSLLVLLGLALHRAGGDDELSPPACSRQELVHCQQEYERCKLESGPAGPGYTQLACACSDQYYGVCVRRAGCASVLMTDCIDTLTQGRCADPSVCGVNCVTPGLIDKDEAHLLPVNNYGSNYLRFSVCTRRHNKRSLNKYSMVREGRV